MLQGCHISDDSVGVVSLGILGFWLVCASWLYVVDGYVASLELKHVPKAVVSGHHANV